MQTDAFLPRVAKGTIAAVDGVVGNAEMRIPDAALSVCWTVIVAAVDPAVWNTSIRINPGAIRTDRTTATVAAVLSNWGLVLRLTPEAAELAHALKNKCFPLRAGAARRS